MFVKVKNDERGLLFKDGNYIKHLKPGKYFFPPFLSYKIIMMDIGKPFSVPDKDIDIFLHDEALLKALSVIDVSDHEIVIHYENEKLEDVYTSGKYAFWNVLKKHRYKRIDIRNPQVAEDIDPSTFRDEKIFPFFTQFEVADYEIGILYYNNVMQGTLKSGKYYFWNGPATVEVKKVDLRQQQLDMAGQEILTEDKITLRLNFVCHYKIVDPQKVLKIKSPEQQIYILLQLILREYVGSLTLDALLNKKQEIGDYILSQLKAKGKDFGIEFLFAGVKDIILPGDIKEILNTVLIAEKKAQANVITRREETASTRSLLNTAKLMNDNPTLYRLKELEFLEKICEKIGSISLTGGGNLLEQLNSLLAKDNTKTDAVKNNL